MDFINLRWLLPSLLFVSVAAHANKVSTDRVVGTTSYAVKDTTISKPSNTTFSPIRDLNPTPSVQRLPNGGLSQSASGDLYIAEKSGKRLSTPVKGAFKFAKDNLKSGAKNVLKRNPLLFAGELGLMGLDKLLRDHGWEPYEDGSGFSKPSLVDYPAFDQLPDGGKGQINPDLKPTDGDYSKYKVWISSTSYNIAADPPRYPDYVIGAFDNHGSWTAAKSCPRTYLSEKLAAFKYRYNQAGVCYYGYKDISDAPENKPTPATESDIDELVDNNYEPHEDDWDKIYPYIYPDSYEIQSVPSVSSSPTITTSTNTSTGDTITTETKTDYDFDVDNSTSTPSITVTETETSTKYENGVKVDETTSVTPHNPTAPIPESGSGDQSPTFELPSFCSWASVVCNWIGWTQQMPEGDEPDLSRLMNDYEFEQTNTISFGSKQCPQPITLNLVLISKPLTVSFDAFCSLAGYLYFMVMASAYIIAARITLGVARG